MRNLHCIDPDNLIKHKQILTRINTAIQKIEQSIDREIKSNREILYKLRGTYKEEQVLC